MTLVCPHPSFDLADLPAIWDNRCTFHRATFDYMNLGERSGNRAVGIGEAPYFDPQSTSRAEALGVPSTPQHMNGHGHGGMHHGMDQGHRMGHGNHEMGHGSESQVGTNGLKVMAH